MWTQDVQFVECPLSTTNTLKNFNCTLQSVKESFASTLTRTWDKWRSRILSIYVRLFFANRNSTSGAFSKILVFQKRKGSLRSMQRVTRSRLNVKKNVFRYILRISIITSRGNSTRVLFYYIKVADDSHASQRIEALTKTA